MDNLDDIYIKIERKYGSLDLLTGDSIEGVVDMCFSKGLDTSKTRMLYFKVREGLPDNLKGAFKTSFMGRDIKDLKRDLIGL